MSQSNGPLQLPPVQPPVPMTGSLAPPIQGISQGRTLRHKFFEPVLLTQDISQRLNPGGPPRCLNRRLPTQVSESPVIDTDPSSAVLAADNEIASICSSRHSQRRSKQRPSLPQVPLKHPSQIALKAVTYYAPKPPGQNSSRALKLPLPGPPSPKTVSETIYTRNVLGRNTGFCWRSDLDSELEGRDAEFAEMAHHRADCQRAEGRRCREQAAEWREANERQLQMFARRWRQEHHSTQPNYSVDQSDEEPMSPLSLSRPQRWDEEPMSPSRPQRWNEEPMSPSRPQRWKQNPREENTSRNEVDDPTDLDVIAKSASSSPSEGTKSRTTGLLRSSGLRPKQPLKMRQLRVIRNRREKAKRRLQEQEEHNDSVDMVAQTEYRCPTSRVTFTEPELVQEELPPDRMVVE